MSELQKEAVLIQMVGEGLDRSSEMDNLRKAGLREVFLLSLHNGVEQLE